MLTSKILKKVLLYNPETGIFYWKETANKKLKVGDIAGTRNNGYITIKVLGKQYKAHRLAFLYMIGEMPKHTIDHIDGNKQNNSWNNLRDVPHIVNCNNVLKCNRNSKTGLLGVTDKGTGYFEAKIRILGKVKYLGHFKTKEEAHRAYIEERNACTL